MQRLGDNIVFSPSDLNHFLECEHLITLELTPAKPTPSDQEQSEAGRGRETVDRRTRSDPYGSQIIYSFGRYSDLHVEPNDLVDAVDVAARLPDRRLKLLLGQRFPGARIVLKIDDTFGDRHIQLTHHQVPWRTDRSKCDNRSL